MARSPNAEQKLAIEHFGGVSLKAGAGAGKTFVIVEHLVYIIKDFLDKNQGQDKLNKEIAIRDFLSQRVLMTFTNKAVGEITIRVQKKVDDLCKESIEWELVRENLSFLNITTIHGFCFKLIRQGLIPDAPANFELVDENIIKNKVSDIIKKWFEVSDLKQSHPDLYKRLGISFDQSLETILSVIVSPEVRMIWRYERGDNFNRVLKDEYFSKLFDLSGCSLDFDLDLMNYIDEGSKDWFIYLKSVTDFLAAEGGIHSDNIGQFHDILVRDGKRAPMPPKKYPEVKVILDNVKNVRDVLKVYSEDIDAFVNDRDNKSLQWIYIFYEIYDYVEKNYYEDGKVSFSDLEFLVASAVKNKEAAKKIANEYQYFIVDEFQDTSLIQFQILSQIIEEDYDRIFCVGDLKQAIYGFRGGDLTVFDLCIKKTKQVLSLANNYRSKGKVIDFNNQLFESLFQKGLEFNDGHFEQVLLEYQVCPSDEIKDKGKILKASVCIESETKPTQTDYDRLEAFGLMGLIKEIEKNSSGDKKEKICVLYKNLKPSFYLIGELLKTDFNFKAQAKLNFSNDPVNYIFTIALECYLFTKVNKELAQTVFQKHLDGLYELMGFDTDSIDKEIFFNFCRDYDFYGLDFAIERFIYSLNFSFSDTERNHEIIKELCELCHGDPEALYTMLIENSDISYSLIFSKNHANSKNNCEITIMTAHASKGLEFDNVLLGGIQTNGRSRSSGDDLFGKWPLSFKWKKETEQKKFYKSPEYILEELTQKKTDFNESMRLFYVACTRAVNNLGWVELNYDGKNVFYSKNSWVNGLYTFQEEKAFPIINYDFSYNNTKNDEEDEGSEESSLPLLHIDNIGIVPKLSEERYRLGLISETSVTKLTDLKECPQKFYLKHILKIDIDSLNDDSKKREVFLNDEYENETEDKFIKNSAERGTKIHDILSETIKQNGVVPRNVTEELKKQIEWVLGEISTLMNGGWEFISEQVLKFDVFGQMITGIPDLVCISPDKQKIEIWDFKTGRETEEKNQKYFFQLYFYAYAAYKLQLANGLNNDCVLKIVYVDQNNCRTQTVTKDQVFTYVKEEWEKLASFDQVNDSVECKCEFGNLCHISMP